MFRGKIVCGTKELLWGQRTHVMGVLNVTPDSFSDSGDFVHVEAAVKHALEMVESGVDVIDIGGESTRPGAKLLSPAEELKRVLPVVRALAKRNIRCLSIDTRNAMTAKACADEGVSWLNDISALRHDPKMPEAALCFDGVVLMHAQGTPETMQMGEIIYDDVVRVVHDFLGERVQFAMQHGILKDKLIVDPGIGFGKRLVHDLALSRALAQFQGVGAAVLYGPSRKRFLGELTGLQHPKDRESATIAAISMAAINGVDLVRVHDVKGAVQALKVLDTLVRGDHG